MGFLWQLLPGAREARNQVIIGYGWLLGLALLLGVPRPPKGSEFADLVSLLGPVGVGIGMSFVAFLIGSFSDDLVNRLIGGRGQSMYGPTDSVLRGSEGRASAIQRIRKMDEWGVRGRLEGLEASIDRLQAELLLRVGLLLPSAMVTAAIWKNTDNRYGVIAGAGVFVALLIQALARRSELVADRHDSRQLMADVDYELERDPELLQREEEQFQRQAAHGAREAEATEKRRQREAEEQRAYEKRIEAEHDEIAALEALSERSSVEVVRLDELKKARQEREDKAAEFAKRVEKYKSEVEAQVAKRKAEIAEEASRRRLAAPADGSAPPARQNNSARVKRWISRRH